MVIYASYAAPYEGINPEKLVVKPYGENGEKTKLIGYTDTGENINAIIDLHMSWVLHHLAALCKPSDVAEYVRIIRRAEQAMIESEGEDPGCRCPECVF